MQSFLSATSLRIVNGDRVWRALRPLTIAIVLASACGELHAASADGCKSSCSPCAKGEYWRINSLKAPPCGCLNPDKLEYFVYVCGRGWKKSSLSAFLAADDVGISTSFFAHGYFPQRRMTRERMVESSTDGGWLAYKNLSPRDRPFRLVLWSWPGERDDGSQLVANLRKKLVWAEVQGWYLAWVIDRMDPMVPVGLVADSLGAPTLTGALHVLGGGAVKGHALEERVHPDRMPLSAALVAGTMNNTWLIPGHRHGMALSQVDRMIITVNPRDRMLKLYTAFRIGGGSPAVGATGIPGGASRLGPYADRVVHFNVTGYVRVRHWWTKYLRIPAVTSRLSPFVFPAPAAIVSEK